MSPSALLYDQTTQTWLEFTRPVRILEIHTLADILPALHEIDRAVQHGFWAAGFLAYEAAPAFDPAMVTHPPVEGLPLLWFGLFEESGIRNGELGIVNSEFLIPNSPFTIHHSRFSPTTSEPAYHAALAAIKAHIAAGNTYQVNYTTRMRAPFEADPLSLFHHLTHPSPHSQNAPPYATYLHTGRHALCSASPELFFELNGHTLRSKPMKGTAPRGRTLAEDRANAHWLHHSEKNRAENVMIVDMVRNDMGRIAHTGSVHVPKLFEIERYPTLLQMTSTVACETQASIPEIFTALFPCASITGAPKIRTMQIIRDLEPEPRGVYTGALGFIAPGTATRPRRAQFNVAIRTAVVDTLTGQAIYGVGSGIVWDSDPADEYRECLLKAKVLTARRPAFDLLESLLWTPDEGYFLLDRHLARLRDSAEYFDFPFDEEKIRIELEENIPIQPALHKTRLILDHTGHLVIEQHPLPASFNSTEVICHPHTLRLRGSTSTSQSLVSAQPSAQDAALRATLAPSPVSSADVFLFHKTTHREVYEQARAACPDFDEVLLWNERGEVTEFLTSNVVIRFGERWSTPPVQVGLLGGTFRAEVLDKGMVEERVIRMEALGEADEIWAINSVRGWRRVELK